MVLPVVEVRICQHLPLHHAADSKHKIQGFAGLASNFHLQGLNLFIIIFQRQLCATHSFFILYKVIHTLISLSLPVPINSFFITIACSAPSHVIHPTRLQY